MARLRLEEKEAKFAISLARLEVGEAEAKMEEAFGGMSAQLARKKEALDGGGTLQVLVPLPTSSLQGLLPPPTPPPFPLTHPLSPLSPPSPTLFPLAPMPPFPPSDGTPTQAVEAELASAEEAMAAPRVALQEANAEFAEAKASFAKAEREVAEASDALVDAQARGLARAEAALELLAPPERGRRAEASAACGEGRGRVAAAELSRAMAQLEVATLKGDTG